MTRSNLVGRSTGRPAGLAPSRILSTWVAARRFESAEALARDSARWTRDPRLVAQAAYDQQGFPGLRPAALGEAEMEVGRDGTVRPGRHAVRAARLPSGIVPQQVAVLASTVFQGEAKSAVVELQPLRYDVRHDRLLLAGRVRFRLAFSQRDPREAGLGTRGRHRPPAPGPGASTSDVIAELHTWREGVHAVAFEALFPGGNVALPVSALALRRQGVLVPFRVAPARASFGPGSVLYFYSSATAPSTAFSGV